MSVSLIRSVADYVMSVVDKVNGMKVLILDSETTGIVSMAVSQSEILEHEVFLVERLEKVASQSEGPPTPKMPHLKAICFVRPTNATIIALSKILKNPTFSEYHVFFSNVISHARIDQLAACDELEAVVQLQEVFTDFFPVNHDLFSLNIPSIVPLTFPGWSSLEQQIYQRMLDGVFAVLLATRCIPSIRFASGSKLCDQLAGDLQSRMNGEIQLFEQVLRSASCISNAVLVICDRRDDPITPLLNQWTYQGLLHELIGLENNILRKSAGLNEEYVMASGQDKFFDANLCSNFGDLGEAVRTHVANYQSESSAQGQLESIEDMQRFVNSYPEFKKMAGNVAKHVAVVHELSRLVQENNLFEVSRTEQDIACTDSKKEHLKACLDLIGQVKTPLAECLRLALLFAIRYEGDQISIDQIKDKLKTRGINQDQIELINHLVSHCGAHQRGGDLLGNKSVIALAKRAVERGLKNIDNVYTQHRSQLSTIIDQCAAKNNLPEARFPFIDPGPNAINQKSDYRMAPTLVIVFQVGGSTYQEAREVREFNKAGKGAYVLLGGSSVHNSISFLADIGQVGRFKGGKE